MTARSILIDRPLQGNRETNSAGWASRLRAGWVELVDAAWAWRVWHLIGIGDLRRRYARSRIGQFWLTLSSGISIGIIGVMWSLLWKMPVAEILPFLAASMVIWQLLSGIITDATTAFPASAHYLLSQRIACATIVLSLIYRNLLVFLHNAVIIVIVFLIFNRPLSVGAFLVFPALLLTAVSAVWWGYVVATLCARFRDLVPAVQSLLQLVFYLTPIVWKPDFLPEHWRWLNLANPFAVYVSIIRDPLMGEPFAPLPWVLAAAIAAGGLVLSLPFIGRFRRRLLYWL